ncbi:MAG: translocation/assembly module TamB [Myxococcales bacterium]|jgi:translocation and assembly module TamB|nr:translocation/assembly module TamB [Myxococcales bacterium]
MRRIAATLALILLLLALLVAFLSQTRPGRRLVISKLNEALAARFIGALTVGDFRFTPGLTLTLTVALDGVQLVGADGVAIARAARIEATVWLPALFDTRLDVVRFSARGLVAQLVERDGTLNLIEALAPRHPSPPTTDAPNRLPRRAELIVREAIVEAPSITFAAPDEVVRIDGLLLELEGALSRARSDASLDVSATVRTPFTRPLGLRALSVMQLDQDEATIQLDLSTGHSALALRAQGSPTDRSLQATIDLMSIDPSEIRVGLPTGAIDGQLIAMWRPMRGTRFGIGSLDLDVRPSSIGTGQLDTCRAAIALDRDRARLTSFVLALPGMSLRAKGEADLNSPELTASDIELDLSSLQAARAQIAGMSGLALPAMKGAGRVRIQSRRTLEGELDAAFDQLSIGSLQVEGATLMGTLPDLRQPLTFDAQLHARRGAAGALSFRELEASLRSDGRAFRLRMATSARARLRLDVSGEMDADFEALRLDELGLSLPDLTWTLARPAAIDLKEGVQVDLLDLRAGQQSLSVRGGVERNALHALIEGRSIELATLPLWLVPHLPALKGAFDLSVEAGGSLQTPTGKIQIDARQIEVGPVQAIDLALQADVGQRVQLQLGIAQGHQSITAQAELPRFWQRARRSQSLTARIDIEALDLSALAHHFRHSVDALFLAQAGTLTGHLDVSGRLGSPVAALDLEARGVALDPRIPMFDLDLSASLDQALDATLSIELDQGRFDAQASLDHALAGGLDELLTRPMSVSAHWHGLALERIASPWLAERVQGSLSGSLSISGSVRAPIGALSLEVRHGALREFRALDLALDLDLKDARIDLNAALSSASQKILNVSGELWRGPATLLAAQDLLDELGQAPIDVRLELGSIRLDRLLGPSETTTGSIAMRAALTGTPDTPRLSLRGAARGLWIGPQATGALHFEGGYADGRLTLDTRLDRFERIELSSVPTIVMDEFARSLAGPVERAPAPTPTPAPTPAPVLELEATLEAELGLSALRHGRLAPMSLPWTLAFDSHAFQLAWLVGLMPGVRTMSGQLDASIRAHGPLDDPLANGFLRVESGAFTVSGLERLRTFDARITLEGRLIRFEQIVARTGRGRAELSGVAEWRATGFPVSLDAALTLDKLPVRLNGQRLGSITSTPLRIVGDLAPQAIDLTLELDRLRVDLIEPALGRELQTLEPHKRVEIHAGRNRLTEHRITVSPLALDLALRLRRFDVVSNTLRLDGNVDLSVRQRYGALTMRGGITVNEGHAEILGRAFELDSAHVSWDGGEAGQPMIDAMIRHENKREGIDVKISVDGTLPRPRIELTSEPPHSEQELALLIATGRLNQKRGAGGGVAAGEGAGSIVGAFLADRLRRRIGSRLPLDVLQFDMGEDGFSSARIEAGTFLTDDLYLGYRRDFGADPSKENVDEIKIEFQLTPSISIESNYGYGDESRGGISIIFNKDY